VESALSIVWATSQSTWPSPVLDMVMAVKYWSLCCCKLANTSSYILRFYDVYITNVADCRSHRNDLLSPSHDDEHRAGWCRANTENPYFKALGSNTLIELFVVFLMPG
jgi:hypothetical protein